MGVEIDIFLDSHIFSSLPLLTCKLCNKILSLENVELPCGHVFCKGCLQSCIQLTRVESCPLCNYSFQNNNQNLKESLVAKNILSPLLTQCHSCSWNGPYSLFPSHPCSLFQNKGGEQQQNGLSHSQGRITSTIQTPYSNSNLNNNQQNNVYTTPPQYYQPPSYRPPSYTSSEEEHNNNINNYNNINNNIINNNHLNNNHRNGGLRSSSTPVLSHNNNPNNSSYYDNLFSSNLNASGGNNNHHNNSSNNSGGGSSMFNSVLNNNRSSKQYSVPVLSPHDQYSSDFKRLCDNCGGKSATKIGEDGLCSYCRLYG